VLDETPFGAIHNRVGEAMTASDVSIEELLRGGLRAGIAPTSKDGAFEAGGLTARKYDLAALDRKTLRYAVVRGVEAGSRDVRIELPGNAALKHVSGRVVSHSGEGLAGVSLHLGRLGEKAVGMDFARSLESDASGRFDFGAIDTERVRIQVTGEDIFLIMAWEPPPGANFEELEIKVTRRCPLKLELTPTAPAADAFSFIDGSGAATQLMQFEGPMLMMPERCTIKLGASEVVATEDTATTLLLYEKGKEVMRVPVRLVPGELTILRP
jgi:hypothetical protein